MEEGSSATRMMVNTIENGKILDKNVSSLTVHQSENQSEDGWPTVFLILGPIIITVIFLAFFVYRKGATENRKRLSSTPFFGWIRGKTGNPRSGMEEELVLKTSKTKSSENKRSIFKFNRNRSRFPRHNMEERQSLAASQTLPPPAIRTLVSSVDDRRPRITGLESSV